VKLRDEEFDVYVSNGVLVEVWCGERLSVAQQCGEDWDGPVHSAVHVVVFFPPPGALAVAAGDPLPRGIHGACGCGVVRDGSAMRGACGA
jgi:hypothetical protein